MSSSVFNSFLSSFTPRFLTSTCEVTKDGLSNFGNTCWFNSLIQTVFRSEGPFKEALLFRAQNSDNPNAYPDQFSSRAIQLLAILEQDNRLQRNRDDLKTFITEFKNQKFKNSHFGKQEDATEALSALFDYLNLDLSFNSVVPRSRVSVSEIGHHSINKEHLNCNIVLPNLNGSSIQQTLDLYLNNPESIANTNGNGLKVRGKSYPFTKTHYLSSDKTDFKELIITLPRFSQDIYGNRKKNKNPIEVDDIITFNLCSDDLTPQKKVTMRLKSLSMHMGELGGGHYTAYVRNSDGSFDYYNDSTKSKHSFSQAKDMMQRYGYFATYEVVEIKDIHQGNQFNSLATAHNFTAQTISLENTEAKEVFVDAVEEQPDVFFDAVETQPNDNVDNVLEKRSVTVISSRISTKIASVWSKFIGVFKSNSSTSKSSKSRVWSNWFRSKSFSSLAASKTSPAIVIKTQSVWSRILAWLNPWHSKSE